VARIRPSRRILRIAGTVSFRGDLASSRCSSPLLLGWEIAAVPTSGTGPLRPLISFPKPSNIWGISVAPDGSVYFDYMLRPSSVIEFDPAAKKVTQTVVPLDGPVLVPFGAGSFLIVRTEGGKRQLNVFRAGIGLQNLLPTSEDNADPATSPRLGRTPPPRRPGTPATRSRFGSVDGGRSKSQLPPCATATS
jgi:hypothetical protein